MDKAVQILILATCLKMIFSQVNHIINGNFELPILPTSSSRLNTGDNWTVHYAELCHLTSWNGTLNQFIDMQGGNY